MGKGKSSKRISIICIVLGIALILEMVALFFNSGVITGLNRRADNFKVYAKVTKDDETIMPGDIYDRNGTVLVNTANVTDEDTGMQKSVTIYSNSMAYAQLLGYTGRHVFDPLAESTKDVVGNRNDARLMAFLDEDYWGKNGALYNTINIDGVKGQSATLTIDDDLQNYVYNSMSKYMDPKESIGSAIVMDVETGAILADVCFPTYDYNDLGTAQQEMEKDEKETNLEPGYPVTYKNPQAPGSIFKVLTAVALLDNDMGDFKVKNTSFTVNDSWTCYAGQYYTSTLSVAYDDELDMEMALNISSNVYFAKAALELGSNRLNATAEKFMMKNDGSELVLDFGKVRYNWDTNVSDDILAQTGFGQGRTGLTTVQAAMITQAIANDGVMMKPYVVKNLKDSNGDIAYEGKAEKLSQATSKKTARTVGEYMRSTAKECCALHNLDREATIFDEYGVAGKTGTAENGDSASTTNAWYISFAPVDDPKYAVVVNQCKTDHKYGYKMMPVVADIYEYLFTTFAE